LISVSAVPGGNPVAKNDPENWAVTYGRCALCNASWCDRCMAKLGAPECPKDKVKLTMFGPVPEETQRPGPQAAVASAARPWWKFWG
jgi:hypothetical protein